jgi:hypothetical protein
VKTAQEIAADLGTTSMIALDTSSVGLQHASPGRSWSGQIYVRTPQLLKAFGISASEINPDADILTMRPGLSTTSLMQLTYGAYDSNNYGNAGRSGGPNGSGQWPCPAGSCLANPPIQEISQLPSGTSAPNTVVTEHAISTLHLQNSVQPNGWLTTVPGGLTPAQITTAQQLAAATAGALGFTGAVVGIVGGYVAALGFFRSNSLDSLSSLSSIPVTNLLIILVGMPLAATVLGWLLAGRDPADLGRQPLE